MVWLRAGASNTFPWTQENFRHIEHILKSSHPFSFACLNIICLITLILRDWQQYCGKGGSKQFTHHIKRTLK
jgi:hypothetical protein